MDLYDVIDQVVALLQQRGRLTYRALQYQFKLDEEGVEALKAELIDGQQVARDEGGKVLAWVGERTQPETEKRSSGETEKEQTRSSDARLQALDPGRDTAERRQLTVMFCDLVG